MCLSKFSWYLPLSSHQHLYIQHCERAETSAGVYLCMRGAGWSHSSLYKPSRFYWGSDFIQKHNYNLSITPVQHRWFRLYVFSRFRHKWKYLTCACTLQAYTVLCTPDTHSLLWPNHLQYPLLSWACRYVGQWMGVIYSVYLNINHPFRNRIILPSVCWSFLRRNL